MNSELIGFYMEARNVCTPRIALAHARLSVRTGVPIRTLIKMAPGPKPKQSKNIRDEAKQAKADAAFCRSYDC
jgi:hypothetical protein